MHIAVDWILAPLFNTATFRAGRLPSPLKEPSAVPSPAPRRAACDHCRGGLMVVELRQNSRSTVVTRTVGKRAMVAQGFRASLGRV